MKTSKARWTVGSVAIAGTMFLLGMQVEGQERGEIESSGSAAAPESDLYRATEVVGMVIRDDGGEPIGEVSDIVIDGATQEVQYLIVDEADVVERGHLLIVPWQVVQVHYAEVSDNRYVVMRIGRDRLREVPTFARGDFNIRRTPDWRVRVNAFFDIDDRATRRRLLRPDLDDRGGRRSDRDARRRGSDSSDRSRRDGTRRDPAPKERDAATPGDRDLRQSESQRDQPKRDERQHESRGDQRKRDQGQSESPREEQAKPERPARENPDNAEESKQEESNRNQSRNRDSIS